ncbi:MAG: biotin-independent malonate decarboxylase subunit gamma [Casimicrobiaceae bacterium]
MRIAAVLDALFPGGHEVRVDGPFVHGQARTKGVGAVAVVGTADAVAVDAALALALAEQILAALSGPPRPLVFLVDTSGQALKRHEELIGLNAYLAHVAACVDLARRSGFPSLSLVYGEAVSGGYLSLGLMADRAYALAEAQIRVMDLKAMARITRIPHEQLVALAAQSPVFAPGAASYVRMGAIAEIWHEPSAALLDAALAQLVRDARTPQGDHRRASGYSRGGRMLTAPTVAAVARAA